MLIRRARWRPLGLRSAGPTSAGARPAAPARLVPERGARHSGPVTSPASVDGGTRRFPWGRVAAIVVLLGIALLWIFALAQDARRAPGTLDDPAFAERAQELCLATGVTLAGLPPAFEAGSAAERAQMIDRADEALSAMVADLRAIAPPAERDGRMVGEWLDDWTVYLGDRSDYASRLREDEGARFYVSAKNEDQITEPIDRFAQINRMEACATPQDLG